MTESAPLVFATASALERFAVDPDAFARWVAGLDDTVFPDLPDRSQEARRRPRRPITPRGRR